MKDIYRIYLNIRSRKDSRTLFLDSMTDALNHKMDEDDRR
ncbi:MAG: RteC domain-containing protein [Dysgonamonadaceae bacterium]|nr:RteC domain-containing protein [Dysgonamonadaceae bacterium]